jgi:tRNA pseudouridine32 synthase / 23S rRNA pseudouridine746 synthase
LSLLHRDNSIVVVDKQADLLSVPGRRPEHQDCLVNLATALFPEMIAQPAVHRLDIQTSGVMLLHASFLAFHHPENDRLTKIHS